MPDTPKGKAAKDTATAPLSPNDPIIGGLRKLFDDVLNEPVPDEFLKILQDIDKKSASKPRDGSGAGGAGSGSSGSSGQ